MTSFTAPRQSLLGQIKSLPKWVLPVGISLIAYTVISYLMLRAYPDADFRIQLNMDPLLLAPIAIKVHVSGALVTFLIGTFLLAAPKGFRLHRTMGWIWVAAMAVTAFSSFFITGLMGSTYSPIHALSAWAMIGLPFGIAAIRRGDVKKHRKMMTDMFFGGMVIAGLFSFLPGRLMWNMFFAI